MDWFLLPLISFFILATVLTSSTKAQQNYSGNLVMACNNEDETGPSPAFLYTCNGHQETSCKAFLIFKSQPPYNSVPAISTLTSADQSELARVNNVTRLAIFETDREVIVPVNCSCSGQYYQANTSFDIPTDNDTYFLVANDTYQGLSTCDSLKQANPYGEFDLGTGLELQVPLRCACPTESQTSVGAKYLLTYSVTWNDSIPDLAYRFNTSKEAMQSANGFSEPDTILYPFTTILIPLTAEPLSSQTIIQKYTPFIPPPPSPPSTAQKRSSKSRVSSHVRIALGCSLLLFVLIILITVFWVYKWRVKKAPQKEAEGKVKRISPEDLLVEIASFDQVLRVFRYEELKKATKNFGSSSRIKGSVYWGVFGGEFLAVKKKSADVSKEVSMLSKINHFNLVKLHGACKHEDSFYLVFEYMKNGSLQEWLSQTRTKETHGLSRRLQIAADVAYGLHYLHSFTKPGYIHKNINSSNVLLDSNLRAKISNFSLARTAVKDSNAHTSMVVGTRGYIAPEYTRTRVATPKVDVYAFGVIILELISGKDAIFKQEGQEVLLSAAIASVMEREDAENGLRDLVDPELGEAGGLEYAVQAVKLSLTCLRRDPADRPTMGEVVSTLVKVQRDLHKA